MFLVGVPFENPVEFVPLTVKEIKPRKPLKGKISNVNIMGARLIYFSTILFVRSDFFD